MSRTLFAAAALAAALPAHADISIATPATVYTQNFDSLTTATTAQPWTNDSTLPGWSLLISTLAAPTTYAGDNGGSNAGTFRSYGAQGAAERALGSLASSGTYFGSPGTGAIAGWIYAAFRNDTGLTLDSFTLSYAGEQWRNGGNTNAQPLLFAYGLGSSYATASFFAPGGSFDFVSPVTGATAAAVDGNVAGRVNGLGGTIGGLSWAPGDVLYLRWLDFNDSGNDHGLAIDDLTLSVTAVPEPGSWAMLAAGLAFAGFVARRGRGAAR